ncbi:unnamed protein product [Meloidogyne enterolobii]|uniref:Uncharacterized protein n=1 Tax=Meloidogyne enterolobii TaxID=390850 RepID=A0ACB1B7U2_MELEN
MSFHLSFARPSHLYINVSVQCFLCSDMSIYRIFHLVNLMSTKICLSSLIRSLYSTSINRRKIIDMHTNY